MAAHRLDPASPHTVLLRARLAYIPLLFDREPLTDDAATAEADFRTAASQGALRGWTMFWLGWCSPTTSTSSRSPQSATTTSRCHWHGPAATCSWSPMWYVISAARRATPTRWEAELLLRRSLHLRAALGARPQVAAAQAALAGVLPPGGERQTLLQLARVTAVELDLTVLRGALASQ